MKRFWWSLSLVVAAFVLMSCGPTESEIVESVKTGSFHAYSDTTLEEGFDDFFREGSWEYRGEISEGLHSVYYNGVAENTQTEEDVTVRLIFEVRDGDMSFTMKEAYVGNQSLAGWEMDEIIHTVFQD